MVLIPLGSHFIELLLLKLEKPTPKFQIGFQLIPLVLKAVGMFE